MFSGHAAFEIKNRDLAVLVSVMRSRFISLPADCSDLFRTRSSASSEDEMFGNEIMYSAHFLNTLEQIYGAMLNMPPFIICSFGDAREHEMR